MKMCTDFRRKLALFMAGCLVLGSIQLTGFTVQASTGGSSEATEGVGDSDGGDVSRDESGSLDSDEGEEGDPDGGDVNPDESENPDSSEEGDPDDGDVNPDESENPDSSEEGDPDDGDVDPDESENPDSSEEGNPDDGDVDPDESESPDSSEGEDPDDGDVNPDESDSPDDGDVNPDESDSPDSGEGEDPDDGDVIPNEPGTPDSSDVNDTDEREDITETEVTYRLSDLTLGEYDKVDITSNGSKEIKYHFTEQYGQVNYAIPQEVKEAGLIKFTCNINSGEVSNLSLKFLDENQNELGASFGQASISVGEGSENGQDYSADELGYIGLMSNLETENGPFDIAVGSITFVVSNPVDNPPVYDDEEDDSIPAIPNLSVYVGDENNFYAAEELGAYGRWNNDPVELTDGKLVLNFTKAYEEFCLNLPKGLDMSNCEGITIKTADQNGSLAFKVYDSAKKELKVYYNNSGKNEYTFTPDFSGEAVCIGVMSDSDADTYPFTSQIVSLSFVMKDVPPDDTPSGEYYAAEELGAYGRWNNDPVELTDGKLVLNFTKAYEEFCLNLPKGLDMSNCEGITIKTADQNGSLAFKVYDSAKKELKVYYNNSGKNEYTFTPDFSGEAVCIGVMSDSDADTYPFTSQIVSLSFVMKDVPPDEGDDEGYFYPAEKLRAYERWSNAPVELTDGKLILTYNKQWEEYCLDLPKTLDMSNCEKITIKTADQNATLGIKVYDGALKELKAYYGNSGAEEYSFVPDFKGKAATIGFMCSDENDANDAYGSPRTVQIVSIEFVMNGNVEEIPLGDNLIKNPNFEDADNLDVWGAEQGSAVITAETSADAVIGGFKTYGKITGRDSNYNCFAQDITAAVTKNKEYQYTFYVMLDADDYKDQPDEMRTVQMAPFITADGATNYSCNLTGDKQKVLEPGVWTKFTGTFTPSWTGELEKVVIRILEQGTEYGSGPGVKGTYYATGVDLREMIMPDKEIQTDVPDLKDAVTKEMGSDFIMGVSILNSELSDDLLMQLVTKHFNAVTLGNELKPDAMFGYSKTCPGTETASINGQEIQVPRLDYSRAEKTLDAIYDWNQANPEDFIKIRGHVLVWHSQTPEWFFHEDYDESKPYVSKDTMNLRLEWYIKTMAEHFTGSGSKYKDMFYGWDVVNEAVSDSTGTYRSDSENSSWWAVYHSNEFILNAFTYANKYMPASVELYYNDYNEWFSSKRNGIVQLLKDVKAKDGARIDGMGMQGHYQTSDTPTVDEFETAVKAYYDVVGQVQITELDFAASASYDGTSATQQAEYERQAKRYQDIYNSVRRLKKDGYIVRNITIWGVIDKNSWLQTSSSVGGGTDGSRKQCPLLFDDDYQVKPSYWAFVNVESLKPVIRKLTVVHSLKGSFDNGEKQTYTHNGTTVSFVPIWNEKGISVQVNVADAVKDAEDKVTLYLTNADGSIISAECLRANAKETDGGYTAVVSRELDSAQLRVAAKMGFDIVVTNGSQKAAYNDTTLSQASSSEYYAAATLKPFTYIPKGTAEVDGVKESSWDTAVTIPLTIRSGAKASAEASLMWDQEYLYVFAQIKDSELDAASSQVHEKDSLEIFIDENNHKSDAYEEDDKQYRINYLNEQSFNGPKCKAENIQSMVTTTEDGYNVEAAIKWTDIVPASDMEIGIELQINDAEGGKRIGTLSWYDESGNGWSSPGVFGTAMLKNSLAELDQPQEPDDQPQKPDDQPQEPDDQPQESDDQPQESNDQPSAQESSKRVPNEIVADWTQITSDLQKQLSVLQPNATVISVLNTLTGRKMIVPAHVLQIMIDKTIMLSMNTGEDFSFSIAGFDISRAIITKDLDLSLSENRGVVPAAVIESTCKNVISYKQASMQNRANFGMKVDMHVALGKENAGKYANLYRYDAQTGKLSYMGSFQIIDIGLAMFNIFSGADYVVTVTDSIPDEADSAAADPDVKPSEANSAAIVTDPKPSKEYIVVKGDTLSRIAARLGLSLKELMDANPHISNKNRINIGDKILLP